MRYRRTDMHGLLLIDKPVGVTSMDVIRVVRRAGGHCKVGHAGTLDPLASGLLICCFGRATRRVEQLMDHTKVYEAQIDLSAFSETDDAQGPLRPVALETAPLRPAIVAALEKLTGIIPQTPPAYSAIKVAGQRAYDAARQGRKVELAARPVRIDAIDVLRFDWPRLHITVTCGRGTYIRSLARQIGQLLGTGGYLTRLRRLRCGRYDVRHATVLEQVPVPLEPHHLLEREGGAGDADLRGD